MKITDKMVDDAIEAGQMEGWDYIEDRMRDALTAALPHLQPVDVAAVTKPVTNIETRTPKEVFDIMCDRIRALSAEPTPEAET